MARLAAMAAFAVLVGTAAADNTTCNNGDSESDSSALLQTARVKSAQVCDEEVMVSGSSEHPSQMGVYFRLEAMQYGRPVYQQFGSGISYLYYWEMGTSWTRAWRIGPSYQTANSWLGSSDNTGAACPVQTITWAQWDGSAWQDADGFTIVAQVSR